jgi:S1-C subfamily serine protease
MNAASVHSKLWEKAQPLLSKGAFPGVVNETQMAPAPLPQRRRTGVTVVGALGSLGIGAAAVLGVQAATTPTTVVGQASPAPSASAPAGYIPGHWPGSSTGSDGGTSSDTGTTTTASTAQQVGIVEINTALQYQGARAAGTGMVLTSDGEILTNNHVVDGATSISVTISSTGATYTATVVGTDPSDDVAVLQLSHASGLKTAKFSSAAASVGESVTGVGNAGGTGTLSAATGSVTALDRSITASDETGGASEQLTGLIEVDAAIQAGDSGGPLYGDDGRIIGMDTAASSGGPADGYAIPIATARAIADQIESGVDNATIHQGNPAFLGVSVADGAPGATVAGTLSGSAAESAGISAGDVITSIDGTPIGSADDLSSTLAGYAPGDRVTVTWTTAAGASESATVTLGTGPAD